MRPFSDRLAARVDERQSQLVLGLDPDPAALWPTTTRGPPDRRELPDYDSPESAAGSAARAVERHCRQAIDATASICVATKLQLASFERLGPNGWTALASVAKYAHEAGLLVLADGKRGDVPVTAQAYGQAFVGPADGGSSGIEGLGVDAFTANPLLGRDAVSPLVAAAERAGAGIFVLVRTSNPGASDFQDLEVAGFSLHERLAQLVAELGAGSIGERGLSSVGAVCGATRPEHLSRLRQLMPFAPFLLPGVGAQGGTVERLGPAFFPHIAAGLVTASRSIVDAHRGTDEDPAVAAAEAAKKLRSEVWSVAARAQRTRAFSFRNPTNGSHDPSDRGGSLSRMAPATAGFWSYAQDDNAQDGGRIRRLATAVRNEYSLLTGRSLELFMDRDLQWGEEWKARIDQALDKTTFFIPIVTPRYFSREECRRELLTFVGHAKSLGQQELLLPLLYVEVEGMDSGEESDDEAVRLVSSMQWVDWRGLRLEAEDSAAYRRQVNVLAMRLAEIANSVEEDKPQLEISVDPAESEPGVVDLLAAAEEAMPRFTAALEAIGDEITKVGDVADEWSPKIERASAQGAAPAMFVFRELAKKLDPHATRIEELGNSYATDLVTIDPAVLSLIRLNEQGQDIDSDAQELFGGIHEMNAAAQQASVDLQSLVDMIDQTATISKDLRRPLRKMRDGVKSVLDGRAVLDEWERRVQQVEENTGEASGLAGEPVEGQGGALRA